MMAHIVTKSHRRGILERALAPLALLLMATTCGGNAFAIQNNTDGDLTVTVVDESSQGGANEAVVGAHNTNTITTGRGACFGTAVTAVDDSGAEVARLEEPACDGDVWVIDEGGSQLRP